MVDILGMLNMVFVWALTFMQQLLPVYIMPNLQIVLQVILLLVLAWIFGRIIKVVTIKLLGVSGIKRITSKTWSESLLKVTGYRGSIVELIGDMVKWLVYILFFVVILQNFGFAGAADIFTQIAIFIPRLVGAVLIVVIGFMIADFFGKVFEEAARRFLREENVAALSGGVIKYSMAIISITMALALIGLDTISLNIMLALLLGSVAVLLMLGMKDTFPNFVAGIQIRDGIKPGDRIRVGEYTGVVEKLEPLHIVLRSGHDRITVPNALVSKVPIVRKRG